MALEVNPMEANNHVLLFPFPIQGHISPMIQFSKRLSSKGLHVTLLATSKLKNSVQQGMGSSSSINVEIISDGSETKEEGSAEDFVKSFQDEVSLSLAKLIEQLRNSRRPAKFLVYDSVLPWALDIVRALGLDGAPFFTQSAVATAIFYHSHQGSLELPLEGQKVELQSMPPLETTDLPSFVCDPNSYPAIYGLLVNQFSNFQQADWLFFNTFDKLEEEIVNWMIARQWPVKTIGPTVPSMFLDMQLKDDKDYGLSLFKPDIETCMKWLEHKDVSSVIYVSFGSIASLGEDQMGELAFALKSSAKPFLWVVRELEKNKLPESFKEEMSLEKCLIVNWCPQLEVLAHKAVGCFLTHCGWNSTLEALSLGVPMVGMPQWTDQPTNAKFVQDVWQVGVKIKLNDSKIATREEIEHCIRKVMEGEEAIKYKRNASRLKELAREATSEGGSSDKNIQEFVDKLSLVS